MAALVLSYPDILKLFGVHAIKERTESRAFLAWFLENYYRLDEMEVSDSICDGRYDKGIDGIYVNEQLAQVDVFQSTLAHGHKTLGDTSLKEFAGTMSQFAEFAVRGIFLTNAARDQNATDFLAAHPAIALFDKEELQQWYTPLDKTAPIAKEITFNISSVPHMEYQLSATVKMIIASLSAEDLVNIGGISNGELFAYNVRQWLGRKTKVNKDIEKSIKNAADHQLFRRPGS
jgi:hypothetical protein